MKKIYVKPSIVVYDVKMESLLTAISIQNIQGDVQTPVKKNEDEDFEAGAKHNFNAWTTWD
jgi:hypothetical protein